MDGRMRFIDDDFFMMSDAENGIFFQHANLCSTLY